MPLSPAGVRQRIGPMLTDALEVFGVRGADSRPDRRGPRVGSVESTLWSTVAVLRVLTLVVVTAANLLDLPQVEHSAVAWIATAVMIGWTVLATVGYARRAWRRWPLMTADLAVTCALILATRLIQSPQRIDAGHPTYPSTWAATAVLAWAVRGGPLAGLSAALVVALANAAERGALTWQVSGNVLLLFLAAVLAGYAARLARRTESALAQAVEVAAATAERERLSREIHDGVLQVLALVTRRGAELGGPVAELGRLAAEQERSLRTLVARGPAAPPRAGLVDVRAELLALTAAPHRQLAGPATPVLLPTGPAQALVAATAAALHNVTVHVGEQAPAWLLLEEEPDAVLVTVRDEGPGIAPGRLEQAVAGGRLGVAQSIRGRLAACGGTALVLSVPGEGTEVELRVPR